MSFLIDPLVQSFLKEARRAGSAALVAYSATGDDGQGVMRIASNVEEARTQGLWNWLTRLDARAVEAGAKALYAARVEDDVPWSELPEDARAMLVAHATAVLNGAKSTQGRTLNIVQPGDKLD